jgi:hypothetical protein
MLKTLTGIRPAPSFRDARPLYRSLGFATLKGALLGVGRARVDPQGEVGGFKCSQVQV